MGNTLDNNLVSRQAVEKMIKAEMPERGMWEIEGDTVKDTVCEVCADLMQKLSELPPVTPKEKTGKWKVQHTNLSNLPSDTIVTCLECGHTKSRVDGEILNFCPKCGARMII